jgi:predicted transcriptional regulator
MNSGRIGRETNKPKARNNYIRNIWWRLMKMAKIGQDNLMAVAILKMVNIEENPAEADKAEKYLAGIDEEFVSGLKSVLYKSGYIQRDFGNKTFKLSSKGVELLQKTEAEGLVLE